MSVRRRPCRARSTTGATGPTTGPRGGPARGDLALWRLSVRRALGLRRSWRQKVFPWTLLAIATIPAIVNVGIGYATRNDPLEIPDFEFITYREYVGVSTALLLFVALTAPRRRLPRPAAAGAAADLLPPAHRRRLRRGQGRGHRRHRVRLRLPAPGRAVRRPDAGRATARSTTSPTTPRCCGRCRWRSPCSPSTTPPSAWRSRRSPTGGSSAASPSSASRSSRRRSPASSSRRPAGDGGTAAGRSLNLLALPLDVRDLVFLGHLEPTTRACPAWRAAVRWRVVAYLLVLGSSHRRAPAALPRGRRCDRPRGAAPPVAAARAPPRRPARSGVRRRRHGRRAAGVGVVRPEGGADRAVVLVRPGRHRPARAQRRRQDHADAGASPGCCRSTRARVAGDRRRPAPRPRGPAGHRARARGRGRAAGR